MEQSLQSSKIRQQKKIYTAVKRIIDIVGAAVALILFSPLFIVVALAIKLEDRGPVLFKQKRSGKGDQAFIIYKFRSMKTTQEWNEAKAYDWKNGVPDNFVFKNTHKEDTNVTKVGHFIRKYSLDELPQFLNVLIGNMSLVGPRPEIIPITNCYSEEQKRRLDVKPGITGWAQINGRSDINNGEKIRLDLEYINHQNLALDINILIKTVLLVITGKGSV